ncbi:MAG: BamA/TamA family outer membrane protein [Bacteroidia bacterium]
MTIKIFSPGCLLLYVGCFLSIQTAAQIDSSNQSSFQQQDIKDWMFEKGWIKNKSKKKNLLFIVPVIGSNPATGFFFGGVASYTFKFKPVDRYLSLLNGTATYSTKEQVNLFMRNNVFVNNGKFLLNGDWRFVIFSENTYGLGTNSPVEASPKPAIALFGYDVNDDPTVQSLRYHQLRFYQTVSFNLHDHLFLGTGLQYDNFFSIEDLFLNENDFVESYHSGYSKQFGFNNNEYVLSGIAINSTYESRDNQVNAYKGLYANLSYRFNTTWLGSSQNSQVLNAELKTYFHFKKRDVLTFWLWGQFVTNGYAPYLALPAIGYDARQSSGRAYAFGRYRGENIFYAETEFRFPISKRTGIIGGVIFLNVTTTSDQQNNVKLFRYNSPGGGAGLRIMIDKATRTNLQLDAATGKKSSGFYLGAGEVF